MLVATEMQNKIDVDVQKTSAGGQARRQDSHVDATSIVRSGLERNSV